MNYLEMPFLLIRVPVKTDLVPNLKKLNERKTTRNLLFKSQEELSVWLSLVLLQLPRRMGVIRRITPPRLVLL